MNLISIGVFLVIGPGLFFLISSYVDCSKVEKDKQSECKTFASIGSLMIIPPICGVGLTSYVVIWAKPDNTSQKESGKN